MTQFVNALVLGSVYTLFSLGFTLSWGTLDILNMAHGAVFMISAYGAYEIYIHAHIDIVVLVLAATVLGGLLTILLDAFVFEPIQSRAAKGERFEERMLVAGVGAATILTTIAVVKTGDEPYGLVVHTAAIRLLGGSVTVIQLVVFGLGIGLTGGVAIWSARSRLGRAMRAFAQDRETCSTMGVNTRRLALGTMFLSGALAGLAGALLMLYLTALVPESASELLLKGFAVVILGSVGSIWGSLLASFLLAGAETAVTVFTSGSLSEAVAFGLILIVLLLRPQGLFPPASGARV